MAEIDKLEERLASLRAVRDETFVKLNAEIADVRLQLKAAKATARATSPKTDPLLRWQSIKEMVSRHDAGQTYRSIARNMGYHYSTVTHKIRKARRFMERYGWSLDNYINIQVAVARLSDEQIEQRAAAVRRGELRDFYQGMASA